ncbi:helix-turn-helix domain-containing protein [Rhodoplanes roseus]|uniref:helix-turn-helix domain-containing protein n=1 Tax=Rhodoplanes roseus TaxID=29409 RepID=UPI001AECD04D|nr:helix-turn-helix domain-containing protein [Rhodoplanes roseus]
MESHYSSEPAPTSAAGRVGAEADAGDARARISLAELAAHLAASERTLNRRFKHAVGDTPLGYLQTLRVEVAKGLLESGRLPVDEVSRRVGCGDVNTFRQLFRSKTAPSALEY